MHKMYEEFRDIYEKEFGIRLSDVETKLKADNFLELYKRVVEFKNNKEKENDGQSKKEKAQ